MEKEDSDDTIDPTSRSDGAVARRYPSDPVSVLKGNIEDVPIIV